MKDGKEQILASIRRGLAARPRRAGAPVPPGPPAAKLAPDELLRTFRERLHAARGTSEVVPSGEAAAAAARHMRENALGDAAAVAPGIGGSRWDGVVPSDGAPPPPECDVGITAAVCGVAQTGSLVLSSAAAGELELSLLPDHHICVLRREAVVGTLDEGLEMALGDGDLPPRNVTFVTGPSVTADIEQTLVRGAHGPLSLHVIIEEAPG